MKQIKIQGLQSDLSALDSGRGSGLPVIFLHADSGSATQWAHVANQIAEERRALALDFRGHGASGPAKNGDYSYAGRAADVASLVDILDLALFVIVAHSGGAAVALEYGVKHPKRVAGLLLVEPPTDPRALPQEVRDRMVRDLAGPNSLQTQQDFYRSIAGDNESVRERVLADCAAVSTVARAGIARALSSWNPELTLNAWQGPLSIVAIPRNDNEHALHRLRPNVAHQIIPGTGHWVQLDQPDAVRQAIRQFVRDVETKSA